MLQTLSMSLTGLADIARGWVIGSEGFSANNAIPTLSGYLLWLVWSLWLLVAPWRTRVTTEATGGLPVRRQTNKCGIPIQGPY
jgi:hypothetical protein